jgi:flagellar basal body-associated protein FliL
MAEDIDDDSTGAADGGDPVESPATGKLRPRLAAIIAAAVMTVALVGGGVVLLTSGGEDAIESATIDLGGPLVYYELPEFLVDLQPDGRTRHHIKLRIVAELPDAHLSRFASQEVAVIDAVLAYLRQQRREQLTGEAGAERLRSELLAVINERVTPVKVRTILFKGFLMS